MALDHALAEFLSARARIDDTDFDRRHMARPDRPHVAGAGCIHAQQRRPLFRGVLSGRLDDGLPTAFDNLGRGAWAILELGSDGLAGLIARDAAQHGGCGKEHNDEDHGWTEALSGAFAPF